MGPPWGGALELGQGQDPMDHEGAGPGDQGLEGGDSMLLPQRRARGRTREESDPEQGE